MNTTDPQPATPVPVFSHEDTLKLLKLGKGSNSVELKLIVPDAARILEISTKCLPAEIFQVGADFKSLLVDSGIAINADQESKTKAALDFFKAKVEADRAADGLATL